MNEPKNHGRYTHDELRRLSEDDLRAYAASRGIQGVEALDQEEILQLLQETVAGSWRWLGTLLQSAGLVALMICILMMIALGVYNYITYRLGKKAIVKKPMISLDIGSRGRTTTPISPTGYVRVNGELWQASSKSTIDAGEEIAVVGIEGMTLLISPLEKDSSTRKADASSG